MSYLKGLIVLAIILGFSFFSYYKVEKSNVSKLRRTLAAAEVQAESDRKEIEDLDNLRSAYLYESGKRDVRFIQEMLTIIEDSRQFFLAAFPDGTRITNTYFDAKLEDFRMEEAVEEDKTEDPEEVSE